MQVLTLWSQFTKQYAYIAWTNHYQYTKPMRWNTEINFDLDSSIEKLLKTWLHVQPTDKFVPNRYFTNSTDLFRFFL